MVFIQPNQKRYTKKFLRLPAWAFTLATLSIGLKLYLFTFKLFLFACYLRFHITPIFNS